MRAGLALGKLCALALLQQGGGCVAPSGAGLCRGSVATCGTPACLFAAHRAVCTYPCPRQAYDNAKSIKGKSQAAVLAAIVFLACRHTGNARTFKEICAVVPQASVKVRR